MNENIVSLVLGYWWVPVLLVSLAGYKLVLRLLGVVIIPDDAMGVVTKKWVILGSNRTLPNGAIIALNGEAGLQADTLAPGLHFGLFPWQYNVEQHPFVTIKEGMIGVVEARDGKPLSDGRVLARKVDCNSFQDARKFITNGGERGPQMAYIPPGTFRINPAVFSITQEHATEIPDGKVGIVTTKEGAPLPAGEMAASNETKGHSSFQDGQAFVDGGGYKGLQEQVILAGRYYINPRFATVEMVDLTVVPIAYVGVVIAYVGKTGTDLTGDTFKHGNLVTVGEKGVWIKPLDPGKFPINPHTHKVELVPTANVVLNWATGKTESHKLDENLSTIKARSKDGFDFSLDVSQIIHIPSKEAPKVIARFGTVKSLVGQVLEPTIGNYFRNAAQVAEAIDFVQKRTERQNEAKDSISKALMQYNVEAVDTLIGDIVPPADLMKTLTDRKLAEERKKTYENQKLAENERKLLQQATATADTQASVVAAERSVEIATFAAKAEIQKAEGEAKAKTINAQADAEVTRVNGEADAGKIKAIGTAEADVIKLKTEAMDQQNYASVEIARALSTSGQRLVPEITAGGNGSSGGSSIMDVLLAKMLVKDKVNGEVKAPPATK